MRSRNLTALLCAAVVTGCSGDQSTNEDNFQEVLAVLNNVDSPDAETTERVASVEVLPGVRNDICKQAIAKLNGHSPSIMTVELAQSGIVRIKYARPEDGKVWTNECRLDGNRVVWRTVDAFGSGSGSGRWRDGPYDEKVTFELRDGKPVVDVQY